MKIGDWVRITNPLPEYKGLYKYKNKIGKIIQIREIDGFKIQFNEDEAYLFFAREIKLITPQEVFMEIL